MKKKIARLLLITTLGSSVPSYTYAMPWQTQAVIQKSQVQANVDCIIRLEYPIRVQPIGATGLQLQITQGGKAVIQKDLLESSKFLGKDQEVLTTSEAQDVYGFAVQGIALPQGSYEITLEGEGYEKITQSVEIDTHHLNVEFIQGTVLPGDLNDDTKIDGNDLKLLETKLGLTELDLEYALKFDLNRDGQIDVTDAAYAYYNLNKEKAQVKVSQTAAIIEAVLDEKSFAEISNALAQKGIELVGEGQIEDLFTEDKEITFKVGEGQTISEATPIEIPIAFNTEVPTQHVAITLGTENTPTAFTLEVEDEEGNITIQKYPEVQMAHLVRGTQSLAGQTITVDLGKKVAVKKVTIKVTATEDEDAKLASIGKVEFLEDILENALPADQAPIKNLKAIGEDKEVILTWNQVPNVTGYEIAYGDESGRHTNTIQVNSNKASIKLYNNKELENYKPYYFVVTALNGDWRGETSNEIIGTPIPKAVPYPPDNISVKEGDGELKLSWGKSEDATGYRVYYKKADEKVFVKEPGDVSGTSYTLNGLENDVEYEMYVTAFNEKGESRPSLIVVGTPEKEIIKIPDVPTYNLINTPNNNTSGIKTDHIIDIQLDNKNNVHSDYEKPFDIASVVDGDYETHWAARAWWESSGIIVTFDQPYEMNYLTYVPRLDQKYKESIHYYSITVWEKDDSEPKVLVTKAPIPGYSKDGLAILPFEKSTVKKIKVAVHMWDGAPNLNSASELKFYDYYGLDEQVAALYSDNTFSEIAEGVTLEQIEALEDEANDLEGKYYVNQKILLEELATAKALLNGNTDRLGVIKKVEEGRNAGSDGNRGFAMTLNDTQPLGVVAGADQEIIVYVDTVDDKNMPTLVFTQHFAEAGNWQTTVALKEGRNIIKVPNINSLKMPKGGSIYIRYTGPEQGNIRVHVKGARPIPTLELINIDHMSEAALKTVLEAYIEELKAYTSALGNINLQEHYFNSTEIATDKVLLSVSATEVLKGIMQGATTDEDAIRNLQSTMLAWQEVMDLHYTMMGLSKDAVESKNQYPTSRMNVRYMRMFGKAFMYAGGMHIGIGYGSVAGTMTGKSATMGTPSYFGWGINHEIGHVLNLRNYIVGEVTNNIFSLFAEEVAGQTRLEGGVYNKIYEKVAQPATGVPADVFVYLGMLWQLHLAYDNDTEMTLMDLYPRIHQYYRAHTDIPDGIDGFVRVVSDVLQKDLRPYFIQWGADISAATNAYLDAKHYEVEDKKIYYLNDSAFRYRLNNGQGLKETKVSLQAEFMSDEENETNNSQRAKLTIKLEEAKDSEHILGYEIIRNKKVVAFVTDPEYIDIIGAANNIGLEYSVRVYDKLLNKVGEANAEQMKVSHNGKLSKAGWTTQTTTTGGLIIDMKAVQTVAGIDFKALANQNANYTVKVADVTTKAGLDLEWKVAKAGHLRDDVLEDETLVYFNKPGASSEDTRIWNFDARYMMIEGLDDLSLDAIDILSYPGDNIEILPGAIGKLGQDFRYGDGEEDVIAAGTVVIVGNYRGDAVYNVIKPKGEFEVGPHGVYETAVHVINGYSLMFAEIPEDGSVSTISDGIWIYVPDEIPFVGAEGDTGRLDDPKLTEEEREAIEETRAVLERIKIEFYRVDDPETLENERLVSDTMWIEVPSQEDMPTIELTTDFYKVY